MSAKKWWLVAANLAIGSWIVLSEQPGWLFAMGLWNLATAAFMALVPEGDDLGDEADE